MNKLFNHHNPCRRRSAISRRPAGFSGRVSRPGLELVLTLLCSLALTAPAAAAQRFPRPDFTTDYTPPETTFPWARSPGLEYLDVIILAAALVLIGYLLFRHRSRTGVLLVSGFSIAYFGFWRRGCVCAVGSVQNIALGFSNAEYVIPFSVIVFFTLPLLFALFSGRIFCAGVCPLGALQDLVVWKPVKVKSWLNHVLGMIPWVYLGAAGLMAATETGFPICQWDPFIGFFRLGGPFPMLLFGALVLVTGMFVARPYCRFICPYGVLLGIMSGFSWKHVSISGEQCIQCRLCENACPVGAIRRPQPAAAPETRRRGVQRLAVIIILTPFTVLAAAAAGYSLGPVLSRSSHQVSLALEIHQQANPDTAEISLAGEAFLTSEQTIEELYTEARAIQHKFTVGGGLAGGALALVISAKLISLSVWRSRPDYEPDRNRCLSCARCFAFCPVKPKNGRGSGEMRNP